MAKVLILFADPELERDAGWDVDSLREEVNKAGLK